MLLQLKNVKGGYADFKLSKLNIEIDEGTFTGIIGPNGSGKTTLLKLIGGLLPIEEGEIIVGNRRLEEIGIRRNEIFSYVPSEPFFNFPFTVHEAVLMGRHPFIKRFAFESAEDLKKAEDALNLTSCTGLKERQVNRLSTGEKQRVLLARAVCQNPRIMLLDEPGSHLDIHHLTEMFRLLTRLNKEKITIICVLHDLNLIQSYCSRIIAVKDNTVKYHGKVEGCIKKDFLEEMYGGKINVCEFSGRTFIVP